MANIDDLNNIHNKYRLALEKIDIDKTSLMDELGKETEKITVVKKVVRYSQLDNAFDSYTKIRDRISIKDLDWIATLQSYINDISEISEKIAQEHAIHSAKTDKNYNQAMENVELDEQGTPYLNLPKPFQFGTKTIPVPIEAPLIAHAIKSTAKKEESIKSNTKLGDPLPEHPVYPLKQYPKEDRLKMMERAYIETPKGIRTTVNILRKWKGLYPEIAMTRFTIQNYCKELGFQLEGADPQGQMKKKEVENLVDPVEKVV